VYLEGRLREDRVEVAVRDTGVGIAESDLPRIFDRFYRADKSRQCDGTGLGLAIARWIVEQHGGAISVQSREGEGSTFTVSLPRIAIT
jgi:signal transduction histidine kinase